jgi:hypothetical protein
MIVSQPDRQARSAAQSHGDTIRRAIYANGRPQEWDVPISALEALLAENERLRGGLTAVYLVAVQEDDAATAATLAADVAKKALDG